MTKLLVLDANTIDAMVIGEAATEAEALEVLRAHLGEPDADADTPAGEPQITLRYDLRFDPKFHRREDIERVARDGAYAPLIDIA